MLSTMKSKKHARDARSSVPETADEYQEAADREEDAGGKHRAGDPAKSGRAFLRALEIYDRGLTKFPNDFDLAYNKARLQLEITQQPALIEHVGLPLIDLLSQTLESHRHALRISEEDPNALFNTSQVLISLAELLSDDGETLQAIALLQESLELLSACLTRQEMLFEQQRMEPEEDDQGGVSLDAGDETALESHVSEETASLESAITAVDLLDTLHASLSALTTLVSLTDQSTLQTYSDMAQALTEKKAPYYVSLLPNDLQESAHFTTILDRAIFIAAFADAQYSFYMIDLRGYMSHLEAFDVPGKNENVHALCSEAAARTELSQTVLDRFESSSDLPADIADICWRQLNLAQELYTKATKLETKDAKDRKADIYLSKGSLELVRHHLITMPNVSFPDAIKRSARTLTQNASTYFKGAAQIARSEGDADLELKAKQRWLIATEVASVLYHAEPKEEPPFEGNSVGARENLLQALSECVNEALMSADLSEAIAKRIQW